MATCNDHSFEITVISLARSLERRARAARQLDALPFPWSFQDAIDGAAMTSLPEEYDRRERLRLFGFEMIRGQIGCFLSHREAWKKCVASQKLMLVLEDDFLFQRELSEVLPVVFDSVPYFGVLRLQGLKDGSKYKVLKDYGECKLVDHYHDTFGTTAYFIKPEGAKVLLEKSSRFYCHVDDFFGHDWIHRVKILSVLPYPVVPNGMRSTIGSYDQETCRLTKTQKWLTKIIKLPRSVAKRTYRMRTFPGLFFTQSNSTAE